MAVLTLLISGCSKPEEVISSRLSQANKNLETGRVDDAVRSLEDLNERFPDRPAVLEALGFAYVQAGRNGAAAAAFVKAAENDIASSSLRPLAAEAYFKDGAPDKAAEQLRLYVAEFPGDYQVWQRLGEAEEAQGNLARAIDAYLEWYNVHASGDAAFRLGEAFRRLNNVPQARSWYETTMRHAESHIDGALAGLLALEMQAGDYAAAELTLGQLERNFPEKLATLPDVPDYRADIARWKETRTAVDAARAEQDRIATELAESRRRQQESLASGASTPSASAPGPAAGATVAADRGPTAEAPSLPTSSPAGSPSSVGAPSSAPAPAVDQPASSAGTASAIAAETPGLAESAPPETPSAESPATASASAPAAASASADPEFDQAMARKAAGEYMEAADLLQTALSYDDTKIEYWAELADCYRRLKQFDAAEAYMLEARRRAPDSLAIEVAFINLGREHLSHDGYLARLDQARQRFPANVNLAYMLAHEFAEAGVDRMRTAAAYEDFLLLATPDDPRRREAEAYLRGR